MEDLIFISCSPDNIYYAWQVEVMLHSFRKHKVNMENVHILAAIPHKGTPSKYFLGLQEENKDVKFFFYEDTRSEVILSGIKGMPMNYGLYIPSIVFHLMAKHYKANAWLEGKTIFHHDNDIVFRRLPRFKTILDKGNRCYASDCHSYISVDYLAQKGDFYITGMSRITGVPEKTIYDNRKNAGGAQYLIKDVDYLFWEKVERDSVAIYQFFNDVEAYAKSQKPDVSSLQKWTAGMWSLLYNLYHQTNGVWVEDELSFSFATASGAEYNAKPIMHNAGATTKDKDLFIKSNYMQITPFGENFDYVRPDSASFHYAKEIAETAVSLQNSGGLKKYE